MQRLLCGVASLLTQKIRAAYRTVELLGIRRSRGSRLAVGLGPLLPSVALALLTHQIYLHVEPNRPLFSNLRTAP